MKKLILFAFLIALALIIPSVLSINATTTDRFYVNYGFIRTNDTYCYSRYPCYPNGTVCDPLGDTCYMCSLEGKTYGGQLISPSPACFEYFELYNVENANFNLLIKMIPFPQAPCFTNNTNCNISGWNTIGRLRMGDTYAEADMSACWNWWNTSDMDLQDQRVNRYCPTLSLYVTSDRVRRRIYLEWGSGGGADVDYAPILLGYSTSTVNIEERVSPTLQGIASFTMDIIEINVNIWRIIYYLFIIISLIVGIIALVGILPLAIKWIIKKVTE